MTNLLELAIFLTTPEWVLVIYRRLFLLLLVAQKLHFFHRLASKQGRDSSDRIPTMDFEARPSWFMIHS